jgi:hypothetical protein
MGKTVTFERLNSGQPKSDASELVRFSAQMKITFLSAACVWLGGNSNLVLNIIFRATPSSFYSTNELVEPCGLSAEHPLIAPVSKCARNEYPGQKK